MVHGGHREHMRTQVQKTRTIGCVAQRLCRAMQYSCKRCPHVRGDRLTVHALRECARGTKECSTCRRRGCWGSLVCLCCAVLAHSGAQSAPDRLLRARMGALAAANQIRGSGARGTPVPASRLASASPNQLQGLPAPCGSGASLRRRAQKCARERAGGA